MNAQTVLTIGALAGSALMSGVYFTFSTFVMSGLEHLGARERVRAMQAFNAGAPRALGLPLGATAVVALALTGLGVADLDVAGASWRLAGALAYLASFALTAGYHVPRNNRLDRVDPATDDAAAAWTAYAPGWKAWNHLRTLSAVSSVGALALALARSG